LLTALGVSKQSLLHNVTYDWLTKPPRDEKIYFEHLQDLELILCEDSIGNGNVVVSLQKHTYEQRHAKHTAELYIDLLDSLVNYQHDTIQEIEIMDLNLRRNSCNLAIVPMAPHPNGTVPAQLSAIIRQHPDHVAVKDECGSELTYLQLWRRVIAIATALRAYGVKSGMPVSVLGPATTDLLSTIFAVWYAGGTCVPIDFGASREYNIAVVNNYKAGLCVSSSTRAGQYEQDIGLSTMFSSSDLQLIDGIKISDESESQGMWSRCTSRIQPLE
jgi:hypothetical protein